ncbi:MAG: hypothetical protein IPG50_28130 [Myxococcales bacterium]|nr:hypothetical protein [Myxococcales bacterium]
MERAHANAVENLVAWTAVMNGERPRTEEAFPAQLLITHVSVARGRVAAPLLGAIAVLPILHFVVALLRGPISDIGPYAAALPISAMTGVLSATIAKRRVRIMTIERRRDEVILEIAGTEVRLRFPPSSQDPLPARERHDGRHPQRVSVQSVRSSIEQRFDSVRERDRTEPA